MPSQELVKEFAVLNTIHGLTIPVISRDEIIIIMEEFAAFDYWEDFTDTELADEYFLMIVETDQG